MAEQEEIRFEQAYVDWVFEEIEREKTKLRRTIENAEIDGAPKQVFTRFAERLELLDRVPDKVLHGRLDMESEETFYIGRLGLDSDGRSPLVNHNARLAELFYQASRAEPLGVGRRRTIKMRARRVVAIEDELLIADFKPPTADIVVPAPPPGVTPTVEPTEPADRVRPRTATDGEVEELRLPLDDVGTSRRIEREDDPELRAPDILLDELARGRTGAMGEIVATIQADQDRLIRADPGRVLIIQGGPGTGKTVVALHRVAWVLFKAREMGKAPTALVVGPNERFVEYISDVLPALGEGGAAQTSLGVLARSRLSDADRKRTEPTRIDEPRVAKVKGDERMAVVVRRSVWEHVRPEAVSVAWRRYRLELSEVQVVQLLRGLYERGGPYAGLRQDLADVISRRLTSQLVERAGGVAIDSRDLGDAVRRHLRDSGAITRMVPTVSARQAVGRLFTDAEHQRICCEGLKRGERDALASVLVTNGSYQWSEHDGALLDEATSVIEGAPDRYTHVVVDEAQDLSPMQWRMMSRRSAGLGMTITGDLAQATSEWGAEDWDEVARRAGVAADALYAELKLGYRVPEPTMQFAGRLLPWAAPMVDLPRSFRAGVEPLVHRTTKPRLVAEVVELAGSLRTPGRDESLAVIVPPDLEDVVHAALLAADVGATVVVDELAKGLEFDHTVVVAPDQIARGGKVGLRRLYICLTRATKRLVVVHTRELPDALRKEHAVVDVREHIRETRLAKFSKVMAPRQAQLKVYAKAYAKWTSEEEDDLRRRVDEGLIVEEIAELHGRSPSSVRTRIRRLGLRVRTD